eukprot:XP_001692810.1 predicted protein [Chlamydomonas reinhardtii]
MGVVVIPPNPEPGQTRAKVHLELDKDEARATIDRLKAMLERLKHMKATGEQFRASAQIAAAPAGPSAAPGQPAARPAFAPAPGPAVAAAPAPAPVQVAVARPAVAHAPVSSMASAAMRPGMGVPQQVAAAMAAAAHPATTASSYNYGGGSRLVWECCMTSDEGDHNRDPVQALQFVPSIPGLPGGDGHGGWLLLHSQETDFISSRLAAEPASRLLFAASAEARSGVEYVTVHSLDAEAGMLAYKYKLALMHSCSTPPKHGTPLRRRRRAFGGGLAGTCGAAYQSQVYVYDTPGLTPAAGSNRPEGVHPKGSWKAHDAGAPITAMTASTVGGARVVTGFRDGSVCVWDMRQKPPAASWRNKGHSQSVTGLQVANDSTLVSSSLDGKVCIWDLRVTGSPRASAVPDGSQVTCVKMSPAGDCVAAATTRALVTVDLLDGAASVAPVTSAPLPKPFSDVVWNSLTGEIYAASPSGTVSVFRQTYK